MPVRTPIFFSLRLKRDCWARVRLNDLPLYKGNYIGPDSISGPCNNLLVPGENELAVELLKINEVTEPYLDKELAVKDTFVFELYEVTNPKASDEAKLERRIVKDVRYPQMLDNAPDDRFKRVPFFYRDTFDPGVDIATPPFVDAPRAAFDCDGNHELYEAVRRIHQTLEERDWDGFLDEIALKLRHGERALEGETAQTVASKRQTFKDELFPYDPRPLPLDLNELHFEPRRGGTVAFVTRKDGGYALSAPCAKDPKRQLRTDLLFTQNQGRWRVFA